MNGKPVTNREIMLIGAVGGISLALLKLIEVGFYLGNPLGVIAIAAYLTYFGYIFLGMVVAYFFAERGLPNQKLKKNAFVLGLLAPSLLLAISIKPIEEGAHTDNPLEGINKLVALLITSAWAACPEGQVPIKSGDCVYARLITKSQLEPTFQQALMTSIGRGSVPNTYSFVVGYTDDAEVAANIAAKINESVLKVPSGSFSRALVFKPEGKDVFFVTVGEPSSDIEASNLASSSKAAAIEALKNIDEDQKIEKSAELLLSGRIVETISLFLATE